MSTGLFSDEEDGYNIDETKYKLKLDNPSPAPADNSLDGLEDLGAEDGGLEGLEDLGAEGGANDKPFNDEPFDAGVEADEDENPQKFIQQLAGKLGQSLRKYTEQQGQPDFDLEKFAINSVISATHTSEMDDNDQKDIINKIKSSGKGEGDIDVNVDVDTDADNKDVNVNADSQSGGDNLDDEIPQEENFNLGESDMMVSNLKNLRQDVDKILSMDKETREKKLKGMDWADDHISTSTDDAEEVADFLTSESDNPCWSGYKQVGMKEKDGKEVPNCVPIKESKNNLSNAVKDSNFVSKDKIINKLIETFMTETQPTTKPAPTTVPQTKPDVAPSRRQKPWRPTVKPQTNPKAENGKELIMSEGGASEGRVIGTKFLDDKLAILTISIGDSEKDIKFENTNEIIEKAKAYDEPWIYKYESKTEDGKTYSVGVEFLGHPDTHLEVVGVHDDYAEIV
jgi:hypothetical protein